MKKPTQSLALLLLAAAISTFAFTGCNTVQGVGRDVERTGEHIEHAANRASR